MKIGKYMTLLLIILASLVPCGLAVKQYLDQKKADELNQVYQNNLQQQIEKLKVDNDILKERSNTLVQKNIELSQQLTNDTKETLKIVLGDGYSKVLPYFDDLKSVKFSVWNSTSYPLYNVSVLVLDYNNIITAKVKRDGNRVYINRSQFNPYIVQLPEISTISPGNNAQLDYSCQLNNPMYKIFRVMSKHNITFQYSIYEQIQGQWIFSFKIYEFDQRNGTLNKLLEEGGHNYPDSVWEKNFHFKKDILATGYTDDVIE